MLHKKSCLHKLSAILHSEMMKDLFFTILPFTIGLLLTGCTSRASENYLPLEEEEILFIDETELYNEKEENVLPGTLCIERNKKLSQGYRKTFNDLNDVHLQSAKQWGIEPLEDLSEAEKAGFWSLAQVDSCQYYKVEKLTHSAPYLTPRAKWLLMCIGKNFADSLAAHNVTGYQIIVTSLLRTDDSIRRLRRRNSNASENSAHRYGTTFDISYIHYNRTDSTSFMPEYRLKETLAEVLYDLRAQNRCLVKYEVKQGCFHITTR